MRNHNMNQNCQNFETDKFATMHVPLTADVGCNVPFCVVAMLPLGNLPSLIVDVFVNTCMYTVLALFEGICSVLLVWHYGHPGRLGSATVVVKGVVSR